MDFTWDPRQEEEENFSWRRGKSHRMFVKEELEEVFLNHLNSRSFSLGLLLAFGPGSCNFT